MAPEKGLFPKDKATVNVSVINVKPVRRCCRWSSPTRCVGTASPSACHQHGRPWLLARQVFVERLRKGIQYEDVYLNAYETVSAVRADLAAYIDFYNNRRPHTGCTPEEDYYATQPTSRLAA